MESKSLIPIGSKINIYKSKIKTDLPQALLTTLPREISAKVIDYKITDGDGIGYVLMTERNLKIWIFTNELTEETKIKYGIEEMTFKERVNTKSQLNSKYVGDYEITNNSEINYLLNPINLLKWSLYTLKDIF